MCVGRQVFALKSHLKKKLLVCEFDRGPVKHFVHIVKKTAKGTTEKVLSETIVAE